MAIKIELKNITKRFGDYVAVDNINLAVNPAEFVCLLGPSGCGKTTTLRMIAGLETPDKGNIIFNGKDVKDTKVYQRNTGMVFQNYALFPHKTVRENIIYGLRMRKIEESKIEEKLRWAIELVSIENMENRYPSQLSGGQQQRVALARAIVYDPDVLLLDEPLSALDKKLRDQMRFELKRIQQAVGITTIFVTHDQEEAMAMSDRIIIMDRAKIVQEGAPEEIYMKPASLYVANFLGTSNIFDGVCVKRDGKEMLQLAGGECIIVPFDMAEGERVKISIRPQYFAFDRTDKHDNQILVTFIDGSYLGTNIRNMVDYNNTKLIVESLNIDINSSAHRFKQGEKVNVYFSSKNIIRMEM